MDSGGCAAPSPDVGVEVWWVPQVPMTAFTLPVPDIAMGAVVCEVLARYDLFQYENKVKPDYCNAGGLRVKDEDGDRFEFDPDDEDEREYAETLIAKATEVPGG